MSRVSMITKRSEIPFFSQKPSNAAPSFDSLIGQLQAAHDGEILTLRQEISRLANDNMDMIKSMNSTSRSGAPNSLFQQAIIKKQKEEEVKRTSVKLSPASPVFTPPSGFVDSDQNAVHPPPIGPPLPRPEKPSERRAQMLQVGEKLPLPPGCPATLESEVTWHSTAEESVNGSHVDGGDSLPLGNTWNSEASSKRRARDEDADPIHGIKFVLRDSWEKAPVSATLEEDFADVPLNTNQHADERVEENEGFLPYLFCMFCCGRHAASRFIISPNSKERLFWDVGGMCLICYDMFAIPFQAFEPEENPFMITMDWFALLFWTVDLILAFFTAYYDQGVLIHDHNKIVYQYLRTWFGIDVLVVVPDWILSTTTSSADNFVGMGRMFRALRAMRVLRLLRLLKIGKLVAVFYDMIDSEYFFILINICRLLLFILVLNHFVACVWFWIGTLTKRAGEDNWISATNVADTTIAYEYASSLHWSLTQFTPASIPISAMNVKERIFSILVLFFAMICFSSVVGSVTAAMTSLRNIKGDDSKQFWLLRRYLRQYDVPHDLKRRILKYLEYKCGKVHLQVQASSIRILNLLSEPLQLELHSVMTCPHLQGHPFFRFVTDEMTSTMNRVCHQALRTQSLAAFDVSFSPGDEAQYMYFLKSGDVNYTSWKGEVLDPPLNKSEWVAEAALWVVWWYAGELSALTPCDFITVAPDKLMNVFSQHIKPWRFANRYAMHFVERLNRLCTDDLLTDVIRDDRFFWIPPRLFKTTKSNSSARSSMGSSLRYSFAESSSSHRGPSK